jgi:TonB family protein
MCWLPQQPSQPATRWQLGTNSYALSKIPDLGSQPVIDNCPALRQHTLHMKALHVTSVLLFALSCLAQQPDQASSSPMQVSPDEAFEHLQNRVVPQYPEMGISNRILNNELLDIVIDEQGQVVDAKVKMGHPAFAKASLDAVKQWKYRPFLLNDAPVRVATTVYILYRLAGQEGGSPPVENVPVSVSSIGKPDGQLGDSSRPRLNRETLEGRRTKFVEPKYPPMARIASIKGEVVLAVVIDKEGHVASLRAVSGHPILVQSALDAVKQWTYSPYLVNGEPVAVESTVKVSFDMGQETTNHKDLRFSKLQRGELVHYDRKAGAWLPFLDGISAGGHVP